ncbi:hypothetical protein HDU80_002011 [Chytriomyces hyalinus]|nr:hypothetical protein HDU80_002011 [Chytriomyces hyalinus]
MQALQVVEESIPVSDNDSDDNHDELAPGSASVNTSDTLLVEYNGGQLTKLDRANHTKLFNGSGTEPPAKKCATCQVDMDWHANGPLVKSTKPGGFVYASECHACRKVRDNKRAVLRREKHEALKAEAQLATDQKARHEIMMKSTTYAGNHRKREKHEAAKPAAQLVDDREARHEAMMTSATYVHYMKRRDKHEAVKAEAELLADKTAQHQIMMKSMVYTNNQKVAHCGYNFAGGHEFLHGRPSGAAGITFVSKLIRAGSAGKTLTIQDSSDVHQVFTEAEMAKFRSWFGANANLIHGTETGRQLTFLASAWTCSLPTGSFQTLQEMLLGSFQLKNSRAAVLAAIQELQQCNFERGDAIWAMYTSSTPVIPARTIANQVALHAEVKATWKGQDEGNQLHWKQSQNPSTSVLRYAQSKSVASVMEEGWVIQPLLPAHVPTQNHPDPGPYPAHGTAAEKSAWNVALDTHKLEITTNETARRAFEQSEMKYQHQIEQNERAVSILTQCFPVSTLNRVSGHILASVKIARLCNYYSNGTNESASTQWHSLWNNIIIARDATPHEIHDYVDKIADLVTEYQMTMPEENLQKALLNMLITKLNQYSIGRSKFTGLTLRMQTQGMRSFVPDLVPAAPPAPPNTLVPGPHHYSHGVESFMDYLQRVTTQMLTNDKLNEDTSNSKAVANQVRTSTTSKPSGVMKTCKHHGQCKHDTSECNVLKKKKEESSLSRTKSTGKIATGKTAKTQRCQLCKKSKHALKDCPKVKASLKTASKIEEIESDKETPSESKVTSSKSKGTPSAKAAKPVYKMHDILYDPDITWQPFFESNKVFANDLINENPLALQVSGIRTVLDSGASVWMSASTKPFQNLILTKTRHDGHVNLADSHSTVPIEGYGTISLTIDGLNKVIHNALYVPQLADSLSSITSLLEGTEDTVSFGTENVYYKSAATGVNHLIGK